ncbi:unnamed protein product [Aphanomyces euteiches]
MCEAGLPKMISTSMLDVLQIRVYGQGETIFGKGDYSNGIYFLVEGAVAVMAEPTGNISRGMPFGLDPAESATDEVFYHDTTVAQSGCIVGFLEHSALKSLTRLCPQFKEVLEHLAKMNRDASQKLERVNEDKAIDPDRGFIVAWDIGLFFFTTFQCVSVPFRMAFSDPNDISTAKTVAACLEMLFFFDIFLRMHIGVFEFGNKVMNQTIVRRQNIRSLAFVLDVVALVPLHMINWYAPKEFHSEMWNANKLLRMYKLSVALSRFEQRFVTLTIHVRLFKLLFYTFFLSHWVGCTWRNSASIMEVDPNIKDKWLPPSSLVNASVTFQYYASLFWGFGTMSGCSPRILPTNTVEHFFNVVVFLCGVFLFSYVVGNLSDIVKVVDGNNRVFYAKLSTLRLFLQRYSFPPAIDARVRHFFFYQSFHSIHQEPLLATCLPPSLLTDTRMCLLKPMLDQVNFLQTEDAKSAHAIRMLVSLLVQEIVPRGKMVCKQGETGLEMYFVYTGILDVLVNQSTNAAGPSLPTGRQTKPAQLRRVSKLVVSMMRKWSATQTTADRAMNLGEMGAKSSIMVKVNEILPGSYFGEASLFSDKPRNANIQARTFCTVYTLSRQHLNAVFQLHPTWKEDVLRIVHSHHNELKNMQKSKLQQSLKLKRQQSSAIMSAISIARFMSRSMLALIQVYTAKTRIRATIFCIRRYVRQLQRIQVLSVPYMTCLNNVINSESTIRFLAWLDGLSDLAFAFDIWFRLHLVDNDTTVEFYDEPVSQTYGWTARLWDIVCVLPLDYFASSSRAYFRLNRCGKLIRLRHALSEITRFSLSNDVNYLYQLIMLYILIIYWVGCLYFAMTYWDGFGTSWWSWLPAAELAVNIGEDTIDDDFRRFFRAMYFSTGLFTNTGVTLLPMSVHQYFFVIVVCLCGLFFTSYFISEVSTMFVWLTQHEVTFRIHEMYAQRYFARMRFKSALKKRISDFLSYWWHAHRGVHHDDILQELPRDIKGQAVVFLAYKSLTAFATNFFKPLGATPSDLDQLRFQIACRLRLQMYPHGEYVVVEGSIASSMYFVVKGSLLTTSSSTQQQQHKKINRYREGHYFGHANLLVASCAVASVRALGACELMELTSQDLKDAMMAVPRIAQACTMVETLDPQDANPGSVGESLHRSNPSFMVNASPLDLYNSFHRFVHSFHGPEADKDHEQAALHPFLSCACCHSAIAVVTCPICNANFCHGCNLLVHLNTDREAHLEETRDIRAAQRLFTVVSLAKRWKLRARRRQAPKSNEGSQNRFIATLMRIGSSMKLQSSRLGSNKSDSTHSVLPVPRKSSANGPTEASIRRDSRMSAHESNITVYALQALAKVPGCPT